MNNLREPIALPSSLSSLLKRIRRCEACRNDLPHPPRPVLVAAASARILIVGQAPGRRVHESGVAWDDPSGDRLRDWMGIGKEAFYDASRVALVPMAFCFPGSGTQGDLPPRKECAPLWHDELLAAVNQVQLTLLVGSYSQRYYLNLPARQTLTATVRDWRSHLPTLIPLPHPSPRNRRWWKQNPWFEEDVLPELKRCVQRALDV